MQKDTEFLFAGSKRIRKDQGISGQMHEAEMGGGGTRKSVSEDAGQNCAANCDRFRKHRGRETAGLQNLETKPQVSTWGGQ